MEELRRKSGYICDMDGVIYHGNRLLSGVKEFVAWLYENKKHFYIPDFFIPSLNLEVEIKDGDESTVGANHHPKIMAVDRVKEALKDDVMKSNNKNFNYIKIV